MTEEKKVENIFNSISEKYDLANILTSLGIEKYWRRKFNSFITGKEKRIIDVCCGTGMSTIEIWRKNKFAADMFGVDFSPEMLKIARERLLGAENKQSTKKNKTGVKNPRGRFFLFESDITRTSFEDNYFDLITMVFGIRNIINRQKALDELYRIGASGGHLLIMELTFPKRGLFPPLYSFYLQKILTNIGAFLTKNKPAYVHLVDTVKEFPGPIRFCEVIQKAGWREVKFFPMTFGSCIIYYAKK